MAISIMRPAGAVGGYDRKREKRPRICWRKALQASALNRGRRLARGLAGDGGSKPSRRCRCRHYPLRDPG